MHQPGLFSGFVRLIRHLYEFRGKAMTAVQINHVDKQKTL